MFGEILIYAGIAAGLYSVWRAFLWVIKTLWAMPVRDEARLDEDEYLLLGCEGFRSGRLAWLWRQLQKLARRGHLVKPALVIECFRGQYPCLDIGRHAKLKNETRYKLTKPGSIIFIAAILLDERLLRKPNAYFVQPQVWGILTDQRGRVLLEEPFGIWAKDLEALTDEEQERILQEYRKPIEELTPLRDGEVVELIPGSIIVGSGDEHGGVTTSRIPAEGFVGIIDRPDIIQGRSTHAVNRVEVKPPVIQCDAFWVVYNFPTRSVIKRNQRTLEMRRALCGPSELVFFPDFKTEITIDRAQLRQYVYDTDMFGRVVLTPEIREKLLSWLPCKDPEKLRQWGVGKGLLAGKSNIMLFFGERGTGKTLSARALAEQLEIPFYPIDTADLGGDEGSLQRGFRIVADRAKRWKALVLWDEPEVFIKERSASDPFTQRVVAVILQCIESFEGGMLILATNRGSIIDLAIGSRIPIQVDFGKLTPKMRAQIWRIHIPSDMPLEQELRDEDFTRLAEIPLDGRQIRNAIELAAARTINEQLGKIPIRYLFLAAKQIYDDARARKKQKPEQSEYNDPLGFKTS